MKKLLIATDLSARSDRALRRAVVLADRLDASLEIVHVIDEAVPQSVLEPYETAARTTLDQLLATIPTAAAVKSKISFVRGHGYSTILQYAAQTGADLIVLGVTRHSIYELFRGTTAERIVRVSAFPVLMVKDPANAPYGRVLVATDNSPAATRALGCALAVAPGAEFCLLHITHVPFKGLLGAEVRGQIRADHERAFREKLNADIASFTAQLGVDPPKMSILVREGEIHHALGEQVDLFKPDLLALGTHGRATIHHALIGSLAQEILSDPPVDVLVAKG